MIIIIMASGYEFNNDDTHLIYSLYKYSISKLLLKLSRILDTQLIIQNLVYVIDTGT